MNQTIVPIFILLIILASIQYTLNRILVILREIKDILQKPDDKDFYH